jgi:hypothetical protein
MLIKVSVPSALVAAALMVQGAFIPNRLVDLKSITEGKNLAKTSSPTSNVKGKTFDRFVNIWLENTDYESAAADRKCCGLHLDHETHLRSKSSMVG